MNKSNYYNFFHLFKNKNNLIASWNKETNNKTLATIKDNIATKFLPTMASSLLLKDFTPFYNATIIDKLIKNNIDIIAKTHLDEFGLGGTGLFSAYGIIYNPLDKTRIVGGSSSGSAATFTNDISLSIASDTGNSIRVPASYIGIYGFKPSYGAISRYGLYSYSSSLDTIGFYAHNVKETIEISNILFDKDQKDMTSQKNIEIPNFDIKKPNSIAYYDVLDFYPNYIKKAFLDLINKLKEKNIKINPIKIDPSFFKNILLTYQIISYTEAFSNLSRYTGLLYGNSIEKDSWLDTLIETRSNFFGFMVQKRLTIISIILNDKTFDYYNHALKIRNHFLKITNKIYNNNDLIIMPMVDHEAPKIDQANYFNNWVNDLSTLSNLVYSPSFSLPWIKGENNLPINLLIDSKFGNDKLLLNQVQWIDKFINGETNE